MIVMKFGGPSLRDAAGIEQVLDIVQPRLREAPLLVLSAMGETTDLLLDIAGRLEKGDLSGAFKILETVREIHVDPLRTFLSGKVLEQTFMKVQALLKEVSSLMKGMGLLHESTPRSRDALLAYGELLSTVVVSGRAEERGCPAQWYDSRDFIVTDGRFGNAQPLAAPSRERIRQGLKPETGHLIVTQGFIGRDHQGAITTMGRGGSNYTAALYGQALEAEEVQIWTYGLGIPTAPRRIVPEAETVPELSYQEAGELAYFSAQVVHPTNIEPVVQASIPLSLRNVREPEGALTLISAQPGEQGSLRAIAVKEPVTVITLQSGKMVNAPGFMRRVLDIFECCGTSVDVVATSETTVTLSLDDNARIDEIGEKLQGLGTISREHDQAIVSLVGQGLWRDSQLLARAFSAMGGVPVQMLSLSQTRTNLTLVIPGARAGEAVTGLHRTFFPPPGQPLSD